MFQRSWLWLEAILILAAGVASRVSRHTRAMYNPHLPAYRRRVRDMSLEDKSSASHLVTVRDLKDGKEARCEDRTLSERA